MASLFALVDCNNFFVSCERVFNPSVENKPVVVLSSNDGCVISRSNEAKALGIPMGIPVFKIRGLLSQHSIKMFSTNFPLYGDMSDRVRSALAQFSPEFEIYSIDEAFLNLEGFPESEIYSYAQKIQSTVKQWTGIPVSIGIATTKTLAKVANYFSKRKKSFQGICDLRDLKFQEELSASMPIEELWGIGRGYAQLMQSQGIKSIADFKQLPLGWIKKHMGIAGLRILQELQGVSCLSLDLLPASRKGICCSRSFGQALTTLSSLEEVVAQYVSQAAKKLRKGKLAASALTVFISTSRFKDNLYSASHTFELPVASDYTPELIRYALQALHKIYRKGLAYKKAGIFFQDLISNKEIQEGFFDPINRVKAQAIMKIMDDLHLQFGDNSIQFAAQGIHKTSKTKAQYRSPRYTTEWKEVLEVN